jgi:mono/diheme cytochrome c family protein
MPTRRSAIHLGVLAALLFLLGWGGGQLPGRIASRAGANSFLATQRLAAGPPAGRALFRQHCVKCHGADGTGKTARQVMPEIPDFTRTTWQRRRSDAQLLVSIRDGKGLAMPPWRDKMTSGQARDLAGYVRLFAPTRTGPRQQQEQAPETNFKKRYHRLEEQLDELKRQFHQLSRDSEPPARPASGPSKQPASQTPAVPRLFKQRCVRCHAADGTGSAARNDLPTIPDFTNARWQQRRTDAQLLASILDGKGKKMPSFRGKINEKQARELIAWVRKLSRKKNRPADRSDESSGLEQAPFPR